MEEKYTVNERIINISKFYNISKDEAEELINNYNETIKNPKNIKLEKRKITKWFEKIKKYIESINVKNLFSVSNYHDYESILR